MILVHGAPQTLRVLNAYAPFNPTQRTNRRRSRSLPTTAYNDSIHAQLRLLRLYNYNFIIFNL